jgi:hypothetical protein
LQLRAAVASSQSTLSARLTFMQTALLYLLIGLALLLSPILVAKDVYVSGHTTSKGTYVAPHYRSAPNGTTADNWSTRGNVNPYTGAVGTRGAAGRGIRGGSVSPDLRVATVAPPPSATTATPTDTAGPEQGAPSVITIEPQQQQRPPRILTTNDLPRWSFGGDVFDERAAVLSYQTQQAAKGNPEALYAMGLRYLNGIDVAKNDALGRDYLEAAKKKGNLRARAKLEELRVAKLRPESMDASDK